ncbi:MAG: aspartate aminotransferase family protein [Candidatus Omnitrophica bacterium]|nr:aspartate aminotransferase family protein [Candidatus Omnitrophota bacterium]MCM8809175.1 aspartate aminotransferase family protein [Candidatus Omnitrophota bacterium]MCM8810467.1 aspartate aminotransferase family protein [Candidatus Omnitrophota bacterium]
MDKEKIIKNYNDYVIPSYRKQNLIFVKGQGSYLWDIDGKKYLDFFPGWAVSGLGHCPPLVVERIKEQVELLIHLSNNYYHPWQAILAEKLSKLSFDGKVFFCNSGAEANEAAIKLTRLYGRKKGRYKIISMENSFHGRTLATVTMTGQKKYNEMFEPLPEGFIYAKFNDFHDLISKIDSKVAGIILELIQGEGGVNVVDQDYLKKVKDLCEKQDLLLIFDEVQTGFGRTGEFFAYQLFKIEPDIMTLAKTIGGGFPMGAMIAKREIADLMGPGTHASTFGGSPLACACCLGVIETIEKENLLVNVKNMGEYLKKKLEELKEEFKSIKRIKGIGLMLAFELEKDGNQLVDICSKNGLLINCTHTNVIRIMPAINVKKEEIDQAVEILKKSLREAEI